MSSSGSTSTHVVHMHICRQNTIRVKLFLKFLQLALNFPVEVGYDLAAVVQTDLSSVGDVCLRLSLHCSHGLAVRRGQQIWSPRVGAEAPGPLSALDL